LSWSVNACGVFEVFLGEVTSGRAFALHVDVEAGQSRAEVLQSGGQIERAWRAVCDLIRVQVRPAPGSPALTAGRRAHGIVRRIDERHTREVELTRLGKFDPLTGELNRAALTDILARTLDKAVRERRSCGEASARAHARQGSSRPLFRQQVRHRSDELHARRIVIRR
jgi:hypothetical protein